MRKILISIAAAGTALAFATPASAQYFPAQQQGYGYGQNYGYGTRADPRQLQYRIDRVQRQIEQLGARRMLSRNEVNGLRAESRQIERRLYQAGRYGLQGGEVRNIEMRIARLEQHVRREATDGNRWGRGNNQYGSNGYNNQNGWNNDRDRDGRDDRYEDDHGRDNDND